MGERDTLALEKLPLSSAADRIEYRDARRPFSTFADNSLPRQPEVTASKFERSADDSSGPRSSGELSDLPICHDTPSWDPTDDRIDIGVERLDVLGISCHDETRTLRQRSMKIQVRYFAVFRERLARDEETIELGQSATVSDAVRALESQHDVIARLRGKYRVAVNMEMVELEHHLNDGDELALIPPVAGGTGPERHAVVLKTPLSLDRVVSAVSGDENGGIVTFTGMVRRHSRGREVVKLEYEAYAAMAESVFDRLCSEIEASHEGVRLAIEHRVGTLAIGECAVVIAAAAPHRAEAFAAARDLIDRLKEEAPIWKKETDPSGDSWVGLGP